MLAVDTATLLMVTGKTQVGLQRRFVTLHEKIRYWATSPPAALRMLTVPYQRPIMPGNHGLMFQGRIAEQFCSKRPTYWRNGQKILPSISLLSKVRSWPSTYVKCRVRLGSFGFLPGQLAVTVL